MFLFPSIRSTMCYSIFHPDWVFAHSHQANAAENLELAFSVAESLGIPRFLDVEDIVDNVKPDDKSIMSYVAQVLLVV